MKSLYFCIFLIFSTFLTTLTAQNKRIIGTTSIGLLSPLGRIEGFTTAGFTTITGLEFSIHKNIWLTVGADFQNIPYRQTSAALDIDQSLSLTPLLVGGRFLLSNKSKLTPYVSASAGVTILSVPMSMVVGTQTRIYSKTCLPFTYGVRGGVQYQIKEIFFPFIEVGYQSLEQTFSPKNLRFLPVSIGVRTYPF